MSGVVNPWIGAAVQFHDVLHGFQAGWRMGNAFLEVKLLQHPMAIREEVLYKVFLDLWKAYDVLDRDQCI